MLTRRRAREPSRPRATNRAAPRSTSQSRRSRSSRRTSRPPQPGPPPGLFGGKAGHIFPRWSTNTTTSSCVTNHSGSNIESVATLGSHTSSADAMSPRPAIATAASRETATGAREAVAEVSSAPLTASTHATRPAMWTRKYAPFPSSRRTCQALPSLEGGRASRRRATATASSEDVTDNQMPFMSSVRDVNTAPSMRT